MRLFIEAKFSLLNSFTKNYLKLNESASRMLKKLYAAIELDIILVLPVVVE